jgi:hypothetical protein
MSNLVGEWYFFGATVDLSLADVKEVVRRENLTLPVSDQEFVEALNSKSFYENKFGGQSYTSGQSYLAARGWNLLSSTTRNHHIIQYNLAASQVPSSPGIPIPVLTPRPPREMSTFYADAFEALRLLSADAKFFEFKGFDSKKIIEVIKAKGSEAPQASFNVGGALMTYHGTKMGADVGFMVALALNRGNNIEKIAGKSGPELTAVLNSMRGVYQLKKQVEGPLSITLMRVVQCYPDIAIEYLKTHRGQPIVDYGTSGLLCHPVGFQYVNRDNFSKYAWHFLHLANAIDRQLNSKTQKFTPIKNLWNYLVSAYTSELMPENKRVADIGAPKFTNKATWASPVVDQIEILINNNTPTALA